MSAPTIFDPNRIRLRRDRMARRGGHDGYLRDVLLDGLADRLSMITRPFARALEIGCVDDRLASLLARQGTATTGCDAGLGFAAAAGGVQCHADMLPFADGAFDLVVSAGGLETVNDLPGALILSRRALRPDGAFVAGMVGAGSYALLRKAMLAADLEIHDRTPNRTLPMVDVRAAGDLLMRAGFVLPVADGERLSLRYASAVAAMHDLRRAGLSNVTAGEPAPVSRRWIDAVERAWARHADDDGRVTETVTLIFLTGWAPAEGQPQPARRGSATRSLAEALRAPPPISQPTREPQ